MNKLSNQQIKLDERNHVEEPLLPRSKAWAGRYWTCKPSKPRFSTPADNDQTDDAIRQLTAFPSSNLLQNNQHAFRLLTEGTSVGENRATGEKSPTVRLIDFDRVENKRFMAVCQFNVRVLGTEHHIVPDVVLFVNGIQVVVIEAKSPKVKDALSVIDYVIVHELAHLLEEEI